jgi:hypothetical protein
MGFVTRKKSQASFEYLAVFAIGFVILIPLLYVFQQYSAESADKIQYNKLNIIGVDIMNSAETVYYMGYPARLTLQENFPAGIVGITLDSNWSIRTSVLTFKLSNDKELSFFTNVNLNMSINETYYSPGLKNIRVETRNLTQGHYVEIVIY